MSLSDLDSVRDALDDATAAWRRTLTAVIAEGHSHDEVVAHTGMSLDEIREELTFFYVGDPTPRLPEQVGRWLGDA